jgi:hypothetical protein
VTANAISPATAAARRERRTARPLVVSATSATANGQRGPAAKFDCGRRVWQGTVVVYFILRAFKESASLSERLDVVGRFKDGYQIWQIVH